MLDTRSSAKAYFFNKKNMALDFSAPRTNIYLVKKKKIWGPKNYHKGLPLTIFFGIFEKRTSARNSVFFRGFWRNTGPQAAGRGQGGGGQMEQLAGG